MLSLVLSFTACASTSSTGPRPINVHAVRVAIKDSIETTPGGEGPRSIVSMGKVTAESAVVYTESAEQVRHEETWIKIDAGWRLQDSRVVATR
jgi:hypothetical protein